jgi:prepilin-type N-terminal cleavage/methylation domain-containing protein
MMTRTQPLRDGPGAPRAGFTLVELLLAITLTAMICSVLYGVVYSTMTARVKLTGYNEAALVADRIADMIAADLQAIYVADYDGEFHFRGESDREAGRQAARLTFITGTAARMPTLENDDVGVTGFQEVSYVAVSSKTREGYLALYRREAPLDRKTEEGGRFALLHDQVEEFELRFLGRDDKEIVWDAGREEWEYSPSDGLPRLVLLSLAVSLGDPDTAEDRAAKIHVSRFRYQKVYRVMALPPGLSADMSKLALLEPKNPRAKEAAGAATEGVPGLGGPGGAVPPQGGNPLLQGLPKAPAGGAKNPLLDLLKRNGLGK